MLDSIKQEINKLHNTEFHEYFNTYIMNVQDSNINYEFNFMLNRNVLNIDLMGNLIKQTYERLDFL